MIARICKAVAAVKLPKTACAGFDRNLTMTAYAGFDRKLEEEGGYVSDIHSSAVTMF